jgi:uncharacterized membrane protein
MTSHQIPSPRPSSLADAHEQSVRRLADLVLGAAALADRLERAALDADIPPNPARAERVARLRAFAAWTSGAIDRAVTDDGYAQRFCGEPTA